jgi:hypothetical protein
MNVDFMDARAELAPVVHRARWIAWGLVLQVAGAGVPALVVLERAKKDSMLGQISRYTVRLAWHEALRSPADIALMVLGPVAFMGGAVLVARPFARWRSTLFLLVPVAAAAGILVLGVVALVCALVVGAVAFLSESDAAGLDAFNWSAPGGRRKRKDDP